MVYYTSRVVLVSPIPAQSSLILRSTEILRMGAKHMTVQVVHCTTPGGAGHVDYVEKCTLLYSHIMEALSERLEYFPDKHALSFNIIY